MELSIRECLEGAQNARGLTVIIDVFRAFSLECYLFFQNPKRVLAVGDLQTAYDLKQKYPGAVLIGERNGEPLSGFDCGNSPTLMKKLDLTGRTVIHTTSAGTQGLAAAMGADEIITGSLVNAQAVARYIQNKQPSAVSLVCMGLRGTQRAEEDVLCAHYIRSMLQGKKWSRDDLKKKIDRLRVTAGKRFFEKTTQDVMPEEDFYLCTEPDRFPFVVQAVKESNYFEMRPCPVRTVRT